MFRRRHLRQLRRHCGNIVGDLMIGSAALIIHEFCSRPKPWTHHATSMAQARPHGKQIELPDLSNSPAYLDQAISPRPQDDTARKYFLKNLRVVPRGGAGLFAVFNSLACPTVADRPIESQ